VSDSINVVIQFRSDGEIVKTVKVGTIGPFEVADHTDDEIVEALIHGLYSAAKSMSEDHYAAKALTDPQPEGSYDDGPDVD
jgi:hypothetical protein